MSQHRYLTSAIRAFERAAPQYYDYMREIGPEREFRDAPAPFGVVSFNTAQKREFRGRQLLTDGVVGVRLLDATGRCWREAGVWVEGDLVRDARGYIWLKDHVVLDD